LVTPKARAKHEPFVQRTGHWTDKLEYSSKVSHLNTVLYLRFRPGANVIKLFVSVIYEFFVISWSVCPWQAFQAWSNKHSSLVQKLVNYGHKKFYNIGPTRGL
jgi:hypothetical protein